MSQNNVSNTNNTNTKSKSWGSTIKNSAKYISPFIEAEENKTKKCFNFNGAEDNFIKEFQREIKDYKEKLKDDLSYSYGKHRVFVNTYYLPIMYIIYSFIYKKFYDEQVKRQIIIYTIHKYNKNRLLFDKKSPLIKKVNVFLNTKLNEEKKEEKEELEGGIINQIIENKNILIKFLQEINEKLEKEIDVNKRNQKKYTIFLNDLKLYKDKLSNIEVRINTKNKNKNISTIINNSLLNKNSNNGNTTIIKSKYEDLIKLQTKINLFLIVDNNENTVNFLIKTTNINNIDAIISKYQKKIDENIIPTNETYQVIIDINKELLAFFENQVELYQDYLLKINNKNVKKIFFEKIVTIIEKKITNKNTELIEKTKKENNQENNLLQLLNFVYTSIGVNINFEKDYLVTKSNTLTNNSYIKKTTKIEFDEKLRHYLKEKKDTNKIIEKKLKEFKEDVEFNLKNISNELVQLKSKEAITAEEKKEKGDLEQKINSILAAIKKKEEEKIKSNGLKTAYKEESNEFQIKMTNLWSNPAVQLSGKSKSNYNKFETSKDSKNKLFKAEERKITAIEAELTKLRDELLQIESKLTKLKKKENQYNYKKQILETKEASYKNIIIEIDSNLKELTATKNASSNNTSLKDIFNKIYNNLSDLSNSLDKINKKIQFKQSENKILSLYSNDTIVKMLKDNYKNPIDTKLNEMLKYFTVKKFDANGSNKNFPKINIFMNSFIEEYNKIKDVHNINVELFFNFVFELNNELTTNIIFILEQIKEHNLQKKSFLNIINPNNSNNSTKIKYLTDIKKSIEKFYVHIKQKNIFTNENKKNKKSNSKIKKILAYTDVINLYLSNIIYLTAYLSTYYL